MQKTGYSLYTWHGGCPCCAYGAKGWQFSTGTSDSGNSGKTFIERIRNQYKNCNKATALISHKGIK